MSDDEERDKNNPYVRCPEKPNVSLLKPKPQIHLREQGPFNGLSDLLRKLGADNLNEAMEKERNKK